MSQSKFTTEHYNNIVWDVKIYYSKDNIKTLCKDNKQPYTEQEQTILHNVATDFLNGYICKRIKKYINFDYRIIISFLKTMRIDITNISDDKQRMAYEVRNIVLEQVILFVKGEFDNGSKEVK